MSMIASSGPDTPTLLALSPTEAVVAMFNAAYVQTMSLKQGRVTVPVDNGDGTVSVVLSVRAPLSPDEILAYKGTKTLTYPRLDLQTLLGGLVDDFVPALPTTSQTLADLVAARFSIVNDENDFIIEEIDSSTPLPYLLKANPLSLRWTGQLSFPTIAQV